MLASLHVACSGAAWTVRCDSATYHWNHESRGHELYTLSAIGPETAMKSIRALLVDPQAKPEFKLIPPDEDYGTNFVKPRRGRTTVGYLTKLARLERGAYHLVGVTKLGGVVLNLSEDRLWEVLTGPLYSTPLLRPWMPILMEQMKNYRVLEVSEGYNSQVGILDLETEGLDEMVSNLVKQGQLKLSA